MATVRPASKRRGEALVDVHQPLGVGVRRHDDVRLLGQQGFKRVEEFLLRAVFAGEELHIVDQQQVQRVVLGLQLIEGLALVVFDHVGDELLGVQVQHAGVRPVLQQRIADGVDQMRLAKANAAVDEQRVVGDARRAGHVQRGGAGHLVGAAGHQRVERELRVDAVLGRSRRLRGQHDGAACARVLAGRPQRRAGLAQLAPHCGCCDWGDGCRRHGHGRALQRASRAASVSSKPRRAAGEFGQDGFDAGRVLAADPVALEVVGHLQRGHQRAGCRRCRRCHRPAWPAAAGGSRC